MTQQDLMNEDLPDPFEMKYTDPTGFARLMAAGAVARPAYYDKKRNYWVLLRYPDVTAGMRNPETFSAKFYEKGPVGNSFLSKDGPLHQKGRRMFTRAFAPLAVRHAEENIIRPAVIDILSRLDGRKECDLVTEFCLPLPMRVVGELVGVGEAFVYEFLELVPAMQQWTVWSDNPEAVEEGRKAQAVMTKMLTPYVNQQIKDPGPNLIGGFIRSMKEDGEYDEELLMRLTTGILLGGYETTAAMLAGALTALLYHPQSLARVQADPSMLMPAVEESMRWFPSAIGIPRRLMHDLTIDGITLPEGANVLLCTVAAHYDPEVYPDPERYDIERRPQEMLFGGGGHYCLGAPLARLEAKVGLAMLLEKLSDLRLDTRFRSNFSCGVRGTVGYGPDSLRVTYDTAKMAIAA